MAQGIPADEQAIVDHMAKHFAENGRLPPINDVVDQFGVSRATVSKLRSTIRSGRFEAAAEARDALAHDVLKFIRRHMLEHQWAPSQREIAVALGLHVPKVNTLIHILRQHGLIETGPNSREIRIVGSTLTIPTTRREQT